MRAIVIAMGLGLMTFGTSGCGSSGGGTSSNAGPASGAATQAVFIVTGGAPKGASVLYGVDDTSHPGRFPLHTTLPVFPRAGYYFVSAQLKNGGNVTCKLTIGNAAKVGHASGGHKSCFVRLTNNYNGGWH